MKYLDGVNVRLPGAILVGARRVLPSTRYTVPLVD